LELTGEQWQCDDEVLETLHYGLASRGMIAWSRSLSRIRKELGFLDSEEQSEDLIDVGEDDRFEIVADTFDRGDDRKPDKDRNQPVFNRRGTRFIFPESL
jgi:hypothetical protein